MPYDPQMHHRRSIRLKGYDYTQSGAYFVTICTRGRECVLGDPVVTGIITDVWHALPRWFPTVALDQFVIMPNHVHFILWIHPPDSVGTTLAVPQGRAGASPPPTNGETRDGDVGATLAVACNANTEMGEDDVGTTLAVPQGRAGASPAPTKGETGDDDVGATLAVAQNAEWTIPEPKEVNPNPTLGDVVGAFQSLVFTVYLDWIQANDPTRPARFWQRNYYEHVVRSERALRAFRQYIADNPARWHLDRYNPDATGRDPQARALWELLQSDR